MWKLCHFKQNYTPELLIALKMVYSCFFGLKGNLDFPDFLQKKFYNINSWKHSFLFVLSDLAKKKNKKKGEKRIEVISIQCDQM